MTVPRLAALAALLCLALPSAASAELTVSKPDAQTVSIAETAFAGDRITIHTTSAVVTVTAADEYTDLVAGDGCDEPQAETVTCDAAGVTVVRANLGLLGDFVGAGTGTLRRELNGSYGGDTIHDQPGDDLLHGGTDDDLFHMHAGDDEVVGAAPNEPNAGKDYDRVSYLHSTAGVEVTLPASGTSTGNGAEGESDTISGVEHVDGSPYTDRLAGNGEWNELRGGDGGDTLEGGGAGDSLYGEAGDDTLRGDAGNDFLWGAAGSDDFDGGPGDDRLNAVDDPLEEDVAIDCGDGEADKLDADNLTDPQPTACEIVAPEFYDPPYLEGWDAFMEGHWAVLSEFSVTGGTLDDELEVEWWRCSWDEDCNLRLTTSDPGYQLTEEDVDSVLYAVVTVSNEAGSDTYTTDDSPVIEPAPFVPGADPVVRPQTPRPPGPEVVHVPPGGDPYVDYGDYADVLEQRLAPIRTAVGTTVRALVRRWQKQDPRALARRRSLGHRVTFPETGALSLTWTAVTGGARAAASRRVTIARGKVSDGKGRRRVVPVRPTKLGRALLRRSKRLRVTLTASFVGGPAAPAAPAEAKRSFTLKRR